MSTLRLVKRPLGSTYRLLRRLPRRIAGGYLADAAEIAGLVRAQRRKGRKAGYRLIVGRTAHWLYRNRFERMDANLFFCASRQRRDFHKDRYRFARRVLADLEGVASVIDVACGTGYGTRILSDGLGVPVTGLDIDVNTVAYAQRTYGGGNGSFIEGDIMDPDSFPPSTADVCVSFETIEHVTDPLRFLENVHEWLRPGGVLVVSTPNEWGLTKYHVVDYTFDMFREHLETYFQIKGLYVQNSGSMDMPSNHNMPRRLVDGNVENLSTAECFIAVCSKGD